MNKKRNSLIILLLLCVGLLAGCTPSENAPAGQETAGPEEPETGWVQRFESKRAVISEEKEGVLFQQACEGGFLAYINRKTGERIPTELAADPDYVNDGRYDVYESALFRVTKSGKRNKVRRYRPLPAPEKPEGVESFFSESQPRAFRMREDGSILAIESSYACWRDILGLKTENRYYIRVLKENGVEISCHEIESMSERGLDCTNAVYLGDELLAAPQGNEVLFFGTDGARRFSVSTPYAVCQLCQSGAGKLAVILEDDGKLWVSEIDSHTLAVSVPLRVPEGAYSFTAGPEPGVLYYLRHSELFSYRIQTGTSERQCALLSLGVAPSTVSSFFCGEDGSYHFLLRTWNNATERVKEEYLVASPCFIRTERQELNLGFMSMTDDVAEAVLRFNRESQIAVLEAVDYRNLGEEAFFQNPAEILIMDEDSYGRFLADGALANLEGLLRKDPDYDRDDLYASVVGALADENGELRRIAGRFWIESMAGDWKALAGDSEATTERLRNILSEMPAGAMLYEPYYTSGRLLSDLISVNRSALGEGENRDLALYAKLVNFANLQPEQYSYGNYAADSANMEKRIRSGKLLLMQAHIGSLTELKWLDAYFENGACFVGWPTETGSASRIIFDECIGISTLCSEEKQAAAWSFVRMLLSDDYATGSYGFPVIKANLERLMEEDIRAAAYRVDEDGEFEKDRDGEKIEIAWDSWYSPEWNRHFIYSLTAAQRDKLRGLIEDSV